jgi:hypothetical protein
VRNPGLDPYRSNANIREAALRRYPQGPIGVAQNRPADLKKVASALLVSADGEKAEPLEKSILGQAVGIDGCVVTPVREKEFAELESQDRIPPGRMIKANNYRPAQQAGKIARGNDPEILKVSSEEVRRISNKPLSKPLRDWLDCFLRWDQSNWVVISPHQLASRTAFPSATE